MAESPTIVIGAHRSGTSLVARLLDGAGCFMGRDLEENHESRFFLALDHWVFENAGATWDRPLPVEDLLENPDGRAAVEDYLRRSVNSPRVARYLGARRAMRWAGLEGQRDPWGFKDPRATATLPLWMDIWPDARVVHVRRHGVDVARSLHARYGRTWPIRQADYKRYRWSYLVRASRHPIVTSNRAVTPERALAVWDEYERLARRHVRDLGGQLLEVRYEDLLRTPDKVVPKLYAFAGVEADDPSGPAMRPERAFAYRRHDDGRELAQRHRRMLAAHGYEP